MSFKESDGKKIFYYHQLKVKAFGLNRDYITLHSTFKISEISK